MAKRKPRRERLKSYQLQLVFAGTALIRIRAVDYAHAEEIAELVTRDVRIETDLRDPAVDPRWVIDTVGTRLTEVPDDE